MSGIPSVDELEKQVELALDSAVSQLRASSTLPPTATMSTSDITHGGMILKVKTTVDKKNVVLAPAHPMRDRRSLSVDELNSLSNKVTRGNTSKFTLLDASETSEKVLDEMTSLMRLIEEMKIHFFRYDVLPVFEIVTYDDSDCSKILDRKNLITDYGTITTEEVRRSNYWYMYCVDGDDAKGFQESMQWSCDYLERSMDASLKSRCMNSYLEESATQRGGPLLFRIMMDYLVRNTRTAAQHMVKKIESYKISDTAGEDVTKLKAIIVSTIKRLEHMKDPS